MWWHSNHVPYLNIMMAFPRYGDSHVKDKTVVRLSYLQHLQHLQPILQHRDPYTCKMAALYWDSPLNIHLITLNSRYISKNVLTQDSFLSAMDIDGKFMAMPWDCFKICHDNTIVFWCAKQLLNFDDYVKFYWNSSLCKDDVFHAFFSVGLWLIVIEFLNLFCEKLIFW